MSTMAYWLMKSEPNDYAWDDLVRDGRAVWDGVHNHSAARNMRAMAVGDRVFFYRSQKDPAVVGIMQVARAAYENPDDPKKSYVLVDVAPVRPVANEVTLRQIKGDRRLQHLALVRQSRLSVSPVDDDAWQLICEMAGVEA
jgi:predicted RNA-binding protein with PUA-like domain